MGTNHPIKEHRKANGLTLDEAGAKVGVTGTTVWRWENGHRVPRRNDLKKIEDVFGIPPAAVLAFEPKAEAVQ